MLRTVELVLEIDMESAADWLRERKPLRGREARRRELATAATARVADALARLAGVASVSSREALTLRVWQPGEAGARLVLDESSDRRRMCASHATQLVPGLTLRDTACDVLVEPGVPLSSIDALPAEFREMVGVPDAGETGAPLVAYRTLYRWQASNRRPVDIVLLDAGDIGRSREASGDCGALPAFRELHLSARCDDETSKPRKGGAVKAEAVKGESVKAEAVKEEAVKEEAVKGPEVKGESVKAEAVKEEAVKEEAVKGPEVKKGAVKEVAVKEASEAVFALARALVDQLPVVPSLTDAYARATDDTTGAEPVRAARIDLAGATTPHAAVIAIGSNVARQWFGNERGVRDAAAIEFVHQMRVALRRAKTLVKVFPRWADDIWRTRVEPGIEWLGATLGEARDLDVFVDSTLPALAALDADPSSWSAALESADAKRLKARACLQEALRARRHAQLSLAWLEWLAHQRFSTGPARYEKRSLRGYAAKRARRYFERLTAEPALTLLDAAARHRRRIEAKRLRYTLEFFEPLVATGTRRELARQLGRIQTVLGEGSDAAMALRLLDGLDVTPYQLGFARGWCEAVKRETAREGERLIGTLRKPKIVRGG